MENELLLQLMIFAGCVAIGGCLARMIVKCVAVVVVGFGLFAILVHACGGAASHVTGAVNAAGTIGAALYSLIENAVHAPGIIGLVMGIMARLHFWKVERERDRGIVRFPRYPSPE